MNKMISILIVSLMVLNTGCSKSTGTIKPNPDRENFVKCPACNGYGKIIIQKVAEDKKKPDINEDSCCYSALLFSGCLFVLGWEISHRDDMEYKNRETDREIHDMENSTYNSQSNDTINPPAYYSHRSGINKTVKCSRCNGVGWIKQYEYTITPMYNENGLDEIIKANEELNKNN